ncbi:MAG: hypothetical protein RR338_04070, partial [Clostridia bacterium]
DMKKCVQIVALSIPLAVTGLLSSRLLTPLIGSVMTVVVLGVFLIFFVFVIVSAFKIVDFAGYIKLFNKSTTFKFKPKIKKLQKRT